jgi:chromosome partitioning protein
MRVLAITNQKGGVGKTTTAVNLAASLAAEGLRVLMIDLDPQGNATTGSGITKKEALPTVYQLLIGAATLAEVCIKTDFGFDVLPANRELAGAEVELIDLSEREYRLKNALQAGRASYDFILIDCPPALNMLTVNGLVAADSVLIPMQCEYYALEGLSDLVETLRKVRAHLNSRLEIEGLLRTMFNAQSTLTQQVSNELEITSATRSTKPSCRAMCVWPKRRPTASRSSPLIKTRRARKPIRRSPRKFSKRSPHDQDERTRPRPRRAAFRQRQTAR